MPPQLRRGRANRCGCSKGWCRVRSSLRLPLVVAFVGAVFGPAEAGVTPLFVTLDVPPASAPDVVCVLSSYSQCEGDGCRPTSVQAFKLETVNAETSEFLIRGLATPAIDPRSKTEATLTV